MKQTKFEKFMESVVNFDTVKDRILEEREKGVLEERRLNMNVEAVKDPELREIVKKKADKMIASAIDRHNTRADRLEEMEIKEINSLRPGDMSSGRMTVSIVGPKKIVDSEGVSNVVERVMVELNATVVGEEVENSALYLSVDQMLVISGWVNENLLRENDDNA